MAPRGVPLVSQGVLNTKVSMAATPSACMVYRAVGMTYSNQAPPAKRAMVARVRLRSEALGSAEWRGCFHGCACGYGRGPQLRGDQADRPCPGVERESGGDNSADAQEPFRLVLVRPGCVSPGEVPDPVDVVAGSAYLVVGMVVHVHQLPDLWSQAMCVR